jgi:hypothetical protein
VTCVSMRCEHARLVCRRCKALDCELSLADGVCTACEMRSARHAGTTSEGDAVVNEWDRDAVAFGRGVGLVLERTFSEPAVSARSRR